MLANLEMTLKMCLAEILEREPDTLSVTATLAEQGVDSLLGLRFAGKLSDQLDEEVELEWLYDHPTIAQLATFLEARAGTRSALSA